MRDITKINNRLQRVQIWIQKVINKEYTNNDEILSLLLHVKADLIAQKRELAKQKFIFWEMSSKNICKK